MTTLTFFGTSSINLKSIVVQRVIGATLPAVIFSMILTSSFSISKSSFQRLMQMWPLIPELILFYCQPILIALALRLAGKQLYQTLPKKGSLMMAGPGVWVVLVAVNESVMK